MSTLAKAMVALAVLLAAAPGLRAQEKILVRRLSDSVAVRSGPDRSERVLYYFSPTAELGEGDELEQGSSGHSELTLSQGGLIELHATAHVVFELLASAGDRVRFSIVTLATLRAGDRKLLVQLPGGTRCMLQQTQMEVKAEPGTLRIRNTGGQPITVIGMLALERGLQTETGEAELVIERGQEVFLPLFQVAPERPGKLHQNWGDVLLRHNGGFALLTAADDLVVRQSGESWAPSGDVLNIGGVRTRLPPETGLRLANRRRPVERPRMGPGIDPSTGYPPGQAPGDVALRAIEELLQLGFTREQLQATGFEIPESLLPRAQAPAPAAPAPAPGGQPTDQQGDQQGQPEQEEEGA